MDEVVDADRVLVVNDGSIALSGTPREIFAQKEQIKSMGLELPLSAVIAERLKEKGIAIPTDILTEKRLAEELCKSL